MEHSLKNAKCFGKLNDLNYFYYRSVLNSGMATVKCY